jgi:hypothetical protein
MCDLTGLSGLLRDGEFLSIGDTEGHGDEDGENEFHDAGIEGL